MVGEMGLYALLMQSAPAPTQSLETKLDCPQSFAKFANVTGQTVRNWIRRGKIPTVIRAGKVVRFDRAAAIAALAGRGAR